MIALLVTLLVFALGNALGAALLRAEGFGLISPRRAMAVAPGRWRAPLARACGPLAVYLFTVILFAIEAHVVGAPAARVQVYPGGTAEASGLETGDLVVEMGGSLVTTYYDMANRVAAAGPGGRMPVVALRGDRRVELQVEVDRAGRIGVRSTGEVAASSWGSAFLQAMPMPFQSGPRLWRLAWSVIQASPVPAVMSGPVALHSDDDRSPVMTAVILQAMFSWLSFYPAVFLALLSHLVAWGRGEGRSPRAANDALSASGG